MNAFSQKQIEVLLSFVESNRFLPARQSEDINNSIVKQAVKLGEICTGEHGVGVGKRKFMELEHGKSYVLMRRIKDLLDPKGLMNPVTMQTLPGLKRSSSRMRISLGSILGSLISIRSLNPFGIS